MMAQAGLGGPEQGGQLWRYHAGYVRIPCRFRDERRSKAGGHIENLEEKRNEQAWQKTSAWVNDSGPVRSKTAGIAILNHPPSFC